MRDAAGANAFRAAGRTSQGRMERDRSRQCRVAHSRCEDERLGHAHRAAGEAGRADTGELEAVDRSRLLGLSGRADERRADERKHSQCGAAPSRHDRTTLTAHGFRGMASTMLHEQGWSSDVIERQLAHSERNSVKAAYNHAEHLPARRQMMQAWADYLDKLRRGAGVVPVRPGPERIVS